MNEQRNTEPNKISTDILYQDSGRNMRLYADLRFKQLSLFFILTGAIFITFQKFKIDLVPSSITKIATSIIGIIAAIIFWIMEERAADYYWEIRNFATSLEDDKAQYKSLEPAKYINATNAMRLIYSITIIVWAAFAAYYIDSLATLKVIVVVMVTVYVFICFFKRIQDCKKKHKTTLA